MRKLVILAVSALAVLSFAVPAHADGAPSKKKAAPAAQAPAPQGSSLGLFGVAAGPIGAAALFPSTSVFGWTTAKTIFVPKFTGFKWVKIHYKWVKVPQFKKVPHTKTTHHSRSSTNVGKAVVGCIFGMAASTIASAVYKGAINGSFYWRSQAEWENEVKAGVHMRDELTYDEAVGSMQGCGLGGFIVRAQMQPKAQVVTARN